MAGIKIDLKKELKSLYSASAQTPAFIEVPEYLYLMIDGKGDPDDLLFHESIETLYSIAYTLKFMSKKQGRDFVVMPLEGHWWADRMEDFISKKRDYWLWTLMIMQPNWITEGMLTEAITAMNRKKGAGRWRDLRLESLKERICAQILHLGPYSEERISIKKLHQAICGKGNFDGRVQKHHEIYLGDPRKTAPAKLKTIIRQPFTPF